ncbi:hypothetical protein BBO_06197 [Beauveria brongniartii RCEF 3172]|uniref:Adhesin protein Mad2 n=1 Tax=Beauveria brongniartii RCEF 3172 TaxID=1081107 RepID=A0A167BKJ8_9HYPO|nr:hypothetical protein BBO_06197 [Beauveria brongniartii RCEF 3172]
MKSFAIAAVAALVSIVAATHPDVVADALGSAGLTGLAGGGEKAKVELPVGITLEASTAPPTPPPTGRTNTWHPAHPGVTIDGCDAQDKEWHYVHPCESCQEGSHTWTTSTATAVVTKTIVDCAPTVADCPARITAVTTVTTSICPATNTAAPPSIANVTVTAVPSPVSTVEATTVPVINSQVSSVEVTVVETPCPDSTSAAAAPPAKTPVQVWTTASAPVQPTRAPAPPPASAAPPVRPGNNTQAQPPVIVNGGAQAQIGLFAAVAAVAALL